MFSTSMKTTTLNDRDAPNRNETATLRKTTEVAGIKTFFCGKGVTRFIELGAQLLSGKLVTFYYF